MQAKFLSENGTFVGTITSRIGPKGLEFLVEAGDFSDVNSIRQMVQFLRVIYTLGGSVVRCG